MHKKPEVVIVPGDIVTVKAQGVTRKGYVNRVDWFPQDGWLIEAVPLWDKVAPKLDLFNWHQAYDGGELVGVNDLKIKDNRVVK